LPDDSPKTLAIATDLGAASSSCSYAAVALARSIFRKGANFTAAMAFELASTNLVAELSIILIVLMGWQFALAEFAGGPLMVAIVAVLFRLFLSLQTGERSEGTCRQGDQRPHGRPRRDGYERRRTLVLAAHLIARSDYRHESLLCHGLGDGVERHRRRGLLIAGAISAWVPQNFWKTLFLTSHPVAAALWGPFVGPIVAVLSFVCSVGNIPLAAVLWNGGISFGGVIAFIYADLIVLPTINIYRKYYGWKATAFIVGIFYFAMAAAALIIESVFRILGLIPQERTTQVVEASISLNYTTVMNIIFLMVAGFLVIRFLKTGGPKMLAHMD
jgi:uncharacterized protein